ncbi:MAG TPA: methyltransferase [Acidiphilium sp.]|nr:MAG: methyltransferase [Acidiphilium sp. 21-60-14]OYV91706.1 MAG: methyltransferase [Acidiphilium sp. 37-60-79]OZB38625.1 MAG: methyltransferase [Acidiphilium sp. 34-60-192]HQT87771.1 methyltransferase [Acidiphilium sp.]HQU23586.1 methyltransferase [Acidiphilium sp.]
MSAALPALPLSWVAAARERWRSLRDRLLANPQFQHQAARFPLTRPIARREANALFDLCAGFVYAQILAACVELDLFETLANGPQNIAALACAHQLDLDAMLCLLRGADSLRLLQLEGETIRLGPLGAALRGNPGAVAMIKHHKILYRDLADPIALLRGEKSGDLAQFWPYDDAQAGQAHIYSQLMADSQPMVTAEILTAYPFRDHRIVLDIGGGDGSFLTALARHERHLALRLFDLPPVAALAEQRFAANGLADRAQAFGGDMHQGAFPVGADLITLVRVLHDHNDSEAQTLLTNARAALASGGTILIAEPMAGAPGAAAMGDAYFGFYLRAMGRGRPRRAGEIATMLTKAGFAPPKQIATSQPLLASILVARADSRP